MSMRIRLADVDRAAYEVPDWLEWTTTVEWLKDQTGDVLIALDEELRPQFPEVDGPLVWVTRQVQKSTPELNNMRTGRAWAWLMVRAAGVDVALEDFKPHLLRIIVDFGDADPPPGGEPSSTTSTPGSEAASPESETSTSPSSPGSPSTTPE